MYTWLNGFYRVMDGKYSITLLFFGSNTRRTLLLRPRPLTVSIASAALPEMVGHLACDPAIVKCM